VSRKVTVPAEVNGTRLVIGFGRGLGATFANSVTPAFTALGEAVFTDMAIETFD
jgi:hypothetical protein